MPETNLAFQDPHSYTNNLIDKINRIGIIIIKMECNDMIERSTHSVRTPL